jgi:hypothetical protein
LRPFNGFSSKTNQNKIDTFFLFGSKDPREKYLDLDGDPVADDYDEI